MLKRSIHFLNVYKYSIITLVLITFYAYYDVWHTFFFADDWNLLGSYPLLKNFGLSYFFQLFGMPFGSHFVPIGIVLVTVETYLFGIHTTGYAIVSLLLHCINILLVFYSILQITNKRASTAWLGAAFFAVNYSIHEGVGIFLLASNIFVEMCTMFVLIGLLQFLKFYHDRNNLRAFFISFLFFLCAVFLKEDGFMLLPVIVLFLTGIFLEEKKKKYLVYSGLYCIVIIAYLLLRVKVLHPLNHLIVTASGAHFWPLLLWNLFTLPPKVITDIILPQEWLMAFSGLIAGNIYSDISLAQNILFKTVLLYDQLSIFFGVIIFLIMLLLYSKIHSVKKGQRFGILLYGTSSVCVPLVLLTLNQNMYWIFSRYLYLPAALLSIFLFSCFSLLPFFRRAYRAWFATCLCLILICIYAFFNHTFFVAYAKSGSYRKHMLEDISYHLNFTKKQEIVFIKTSTGGFHNTNDIFGFGTSFGRALLIWNWFQGDNKQKIPPCLYDPLFFFTSPVNDYKQCDGKGYGYFQDIDKLRKAVKQYTINPKAIDAFAYNQATNTFTMINPEIQSELTR